MKVYICDDDKSVLSELEKMIRSLMKIEAEEWEVQTFLSAVDLDTFTTRRGQADIILMDVCLEMENGIEAAKNMQEKYPSTQIIFITGYINAAEDIFDARPSAFLIKPVNLDKLNNALKRAMKCKEEKEEYFTLESQHTVTKIKLKEVDFVESQKRVLHIHGEVESQQTYMKLDEFMEVAPNRFLRVHKSYAVNIDKVKHLTSDQVKLITGQTIPVSRKRYKQVKYQFLKYCSAEFDLWDENRKE